MFQNILTKIGSHKDAHCPLLLLAMVPLSLVKRDGVDFYTMPLNHHSRRKVGIQLEDKALSSSTPQNNFLLRAETLIGLV